MKMQPDTSPGINIVTAYDENHFAVNGQRYEHALLMAYEGQVLRWDVAQYDALKREHFEHMAAQLSVEIIIIGTGKRHRQLKPEWMAPLIAKRMGLEAMSTAAALRTYNILAGEGRSVAAALLLDNG